MVAALNSRQVLFYDGACGLCSRTIRLVLRWEVAHSTLLFAPLQGETAAAILSPAWRTEPLRSVILWQGLKGPVSASRAIGGLAPHLRAPYRYAARIIGALHPFSDLLYWAVARTRYSIWGRSCSIPTAAMSDRFLP